MLCKRIDGCCVYTVHLSSALNGSSEISRFKRRVVMEIRNGIIFDFYTGLTHVLVLCHYSGNDNNHADPRSVYHHTTMYETNPLSRASCKLQCAIS